MIRTQPLPTSVQAVRMLLGLVAFSHLAIPGIMVALRDVLAEEIAQAHPDFNPLTIHQSVQLALRSAIIFHGLLLLLCVFLIVKLPGKQPWVRRLTTISQLLSVFFSIVSWMSSSMFHWVIPIVDLIQLGVIWLLWWPMSSRKYFTVI